MLTANINTVDKLINGSSGEIMSMQFPQGGNNLSGRIFIRFDDPKAGNSLKDNRLRGELKHCVPITAITKTFPYSHKRKTITVQRKQFPLKLAHAITVHNSQGATLEYMKGDFDRTSKTGKPNAVPINPGSMYTILSRAKSRDKLQLVNFEAEHIKVNILALHELDRMRVDAVLSWVHPLEEITGKKMVLFNIRSWNAHIEQFMSDSVYSTKCSIICFTETRTNNKLYRCIDQYTEGSKDIHKDTEHGLALCFKEEDVKILRVFQVPTVLEILPVLIEFSDEMILLCLIYCPPRQQISNFVEGLISLLTDIWTGERIILLGDFNMDQLLQENINRFTPLLDRLSLKQRSYFSTHDQGGILDLVFDSISSECVSWVPSPYSDHFIVLIQV